MLGEYKRDYLSSMSVVKQEDLGSRMKGTENDVHGI